MLRRGLWRRAGLFESGLVRSTPSVDVVVQAGTHSHGQGHETTYAQIAASTLCVPSDDVTVVEGDTGDGSSCGRVERPADPSGGGFDGSER